MLHSVGLLIWQGQDPPHSLKVIVVLTEATTAAHSLLESRRFLRLRLEPCARLPADTKAVELWKKSARHGGAQPQHEDCQFEGSQAPVQSHMSARPLSSVKENKGTLRQPHLSSKLDTPLLAQQKVGTCFPAVLLKESMRYWSLPHHALPGTELEFNKRSFTWGTLDSGT